MKLEKLSWTVTLKIQKTNSHKNGQALKKCKRLTPYKQQGHKKVHAHNKDKLFLNEIKDIKDQDISHLEKYQKWSKRTQKKIIKTKKNHFRIED